MTIWCDWMGHWVSDSTLKELHEFASEIGLKRAWFQDKPNFPHYDLTTKNAIERAISAGATHISPKEIVRKLRHAPYNLDHEKELKRN